MCGRECGRELRGTRRTTRHREHLSRIGPRPAFVQVKGQIPGAGEGAGRGVEPAGRLEPPTPCSQAKPTFIRLVRTHARWAFTWGKRPSRSCQIVRRRPPCPDRAVAFLSRPCRSSSSTAEAAGGFQPLTRPTELSCQVDAAHSVKDSRSDPHHCVASARSTPKTLAWCIGWPPACSPFSLAPSPELITSTALKVLHTAQKGLASLRPQ